MWRVPLRIFGAGGLLSRWFGRGRLHSWWNCSNTQRSMISKNYLTFTHTHINRIPEAAQETNKLSGSFVGVFLHKHAAPAETCLKKVVFFLFCCLFRCFQFLLLPMRLTKKRRRRKTLLFVLCLFKKLSMFTCSSCAPFILAIRHRRAKTLRKDWSVAGNSATCTRSRSPYVRFMRIP